MEPVFGFALYLMLAVATWIVASKRGLMGFVFFIASAALGFAAALLGAFVFQGQSTPAASAGFLAGLIVLITAFTFESPVRTCPACAEKVKKQAKVCKHCGASLEADQ